MTATMIRTRARAPLAERLLANEAESVVTHVRAPEIGAIGGQLGEREIRYVMSSEVPAGYWGDVIKSSAWDLSEFKQRQMPFLWMHGRGADSLPLGRMRSVRKNVQSGESRVLAGIARWMDEGLDEFADGVLAIARAGFLPAGSVSFEVKDAHDPDEDEVEQYGLDITGAHRYAAIIDKAMLIEFSAVSVGADPNAVMVRSVNDQGESLRDFLDGLVQSGAVSAGAARSLRVELLGRPETVTLSRSELVADDSQDGSEADTGDDSDAEGAGSEGAAPEGEELLGDESESEGEADGDEPTEQDTEGGDAISELALDEETADAVREFVQVEVRAFTRALMEEARELFDVEVAERKRLRTDLDAIRAALGLSAEQSEDPYDETDG